MCVICRVTKAVFSLDNNLWQIAPSLTHRAMGQFGGDHGRSPAQPSAQGASGLSQTALLHALLSWVLQTSKNRGGTTSLGPRSTT